MVSRTNVIFLSLSLFLNSRTSRQTMGYTIHHQFQSKFFQGHYRRLAEGGRKGRATQSLSCSSRTPSSSYILLLSFKFGLSVVSQLLLLLIQLPSLSLLPYYFGGSISRYLFTFTVLHVSFVLGSGQSFCFVLHSFLIILVSRDYVSF